MARDGGVRRRERQNQEQLLRHTIRTVVALTTAFMVLTAGAAFAHPEHEERGASYERSSPAKA